MKALLSIIALGAAAFIAGCGEHKEATSANAAPHLHVDVPPHGGTPVPLEDDYQIELVLDPSLRTLNAYFLDGEMENFVRIAPPSFDLKVTLTNRQEVLHFSAVPNSATGEKVGSTSLFEAKADWLTTNVTFNAVLPEINVEGTVYTNVAFNFPKGVEEQTK